MKNSNFILFTIFAVLVSSACQNETNNSANQNQNKTTAGYQVPDNWRKTFFEAYRPKLDKKIVLEIWEQELKPDPSMPGWFELPSQKMSFDSASKDYILSDHFDKVVDAEYAIQDDANGQYLIARNGNRTVSFDEVSFSHSSGNIGIGFVFFTPDRYENEHADHSKGTWLIFDRELTECDTLSWQGSYEGFALSDRGVYDCPSGQGLRFRSFGELFGWHKVPEKYEVDIQEKKGKLYLVDLLDESLSSVLLTK